MSAVFINLNIFLKEFVVNYDVCYMEIYSFAQQLKIKT